MEQHKDRAIYLDGLRGIAALMVVLYHYLLSFYPALFILKAEYVHSSNNAEHSIALSPLSIVYKSGFAVCLFFFISGYALSYRFFHSEDKEYIKSATIRRYFRLEIPILFSVLVSYILLKEGGYTNMFTAEQYTKSTFWLSNLWNTQPNILDALKEALYSSQFTGSHLGYNPVLWTMNIEFMGSMMIFFLLAIFGKSKNRYWVYAVVSIWGYSIFFPAFIMGLALCDYYSKPRKVVNKYLLAILFLIGLYVGSYQQFDVPNMWSILDWLNNINKSLPFTIGSALVMFSVINSTILKRILSSRLFQFLGKISFSLYLLHLILIGSLSCFLFSYFYGQLHLEYFISFLITFLLGMTATIAISYLAYRYIDGTGMQFSSWLYKRFFSGNIS